MSECCVDILVNHSERTICIEVMQGEKLKFSLKYDLEEAKKFSSQFLEALHSIKWWENEHTDKV